MKVFHALVRPKGRVNTSSRRCDVEKIQADAVPPAYRQFANEASRNSETLAHLLFEIAEQSSEAVRRRLHLAPSAA